MYKINYLLLNLEYYNIFRGLILYQVDLSYARDSKNKKAV